MKKVTLKLIKQHDRRDVFEKRLSEWQTAHNTTGVPCANWIGLERVAYSFGVCINGTLYKDIETGELIGVPYRGLNVYVD